MFILWECVVGGCGGYYTWTICPENTVLRIITPQITQTVSVLVLYSLKRLTKHINTVFRGRAWLFSMIFQSKNLAQTPTPFQCTAPWKHSSWPGLHFTTCECVTQFWAAGVSQWPSLQVARVHSQRVSPEAVLSAACFKAFLWNRPKSKAHCFESVSTARPQTGCCLPLLLFACFNTRHKVERKRKERKGEGALGVKSRIWEGRGSNWEGKRK